MTHSVFIDGEAGTTGLQIRERLLGRDDIRLVQVDPARRKEASARAEAFAGWAASLTVADIPDAPRRAAQAALLDIAGLAVAARNTDYVASVLDGWDGEGPCTAFGHVRTLDAAGAAVVNGTAAHGEDFDDTFEGTPIHTGAVMIPAVLAACERHGRSGADALCGIVAGTELMCRMALVAPTGSTFDVAIAPNFALAEALGLTPGRI